MTGLFEEQETTIGDSAVGDRVYIPEIRGKNNARCAGYGRIIIEALVPVSEELITLTYRTDHKNRNLRTKTHIVPKDLVAYKRL